jgi:hypothetical protein
MTYADMEFGLVRENGNDFILQKSISKLAIANY